MAQQTLLKKYFYILKDKRRHLLLMVILFLMSSALDLLGIGLIGPFIGAVVTPSFLQRFRSLNLFMNNFGVFEVRNQIIVLGYILLVVFLIKGAVAYSISNYISNFTFNFRASLVQRLMNAYIRMPYQFYLDRNSASIVNSVIAHTKTMTDDMLLPSLKLVSDSILLVVIGLFLFWVNPFAMFILLTTLGTVSIAYMKLVKPKVKKAGEEVSLQNERLIKGVNQGIGGIKEIRVLGVHQFFLEQINSASSMCAGSQMKFYSLISIPRFLIETVFIVFVVFLTLLSIYLEKDGGVMVATLAIFAVSGIRVLPAVANVSSSITSMNYSSYSLTELYRDLQEVEKRASIFSQEMVRAVNADKNFDILNIRDIKFSYPGSSHKAINGISIELKQGQSIGLIGASGSGKTTFVDMLLGFHKFDSGSFKINGIDIEEYGWDNWKRQIAYIPQNVFLSDEALIKNIAFGVPDNEINVHKVYDSLASAKLLEFVARLPEGLQTYVGDRGVRLSGGERQRVALARAFYHSKSVLIFDEATSALDTKTEREVIEVIESLQGQKTLIVIAHRLVTVKSCDLIYRFKDGRILDFGTFVEMEPTFSDKVKSKK